MPRYLRLVARVWHRALLLFALSLAAPAALAAPTHITAQLVSENAALPGGETTVAIRMSPAPGWHGYWLNPGDAGLGMTLGWHVPAGTQVGAPRYPVPELLVLNGLANHVYSHEYAVLVQVRVPASARPGTTLPLALSADWLACTEQVCVPEHGELSGAITIAAPGTAAPRDPRFDRWLAALPAPLGSAVSFTADARLLRLAIPLPASVALAAPHVFVASDHLADYAAPQRFYRDGDLLIAELARPATGSVSPPQLAAVLRLDAAGNGLRLTATPGAVPAGRTLLAGGYSGRTPPLAALVLAALLGGLILNVMPCVFPILSLKALSLARAGGDNLAARREGLAYSAGVILACTALGGLLLALRAGGAEVGWAFQLQEPGVVAALLLLAAAITANLAGLYEFAVPGFASHGNDRGAFATGLLAAFAATPCTGPFMAAAMGAALLLPVVPALLLFAALGLGLALPFLALAFVPALRRMLPRPGKWMERFRTAMAIPMGLTTLALLWLASRLGGTGFAIACSVVAAALIALLVMVGRGQRTGEGVAQRFIIGASMLTVLSVMIVPHTLGAPQAEAAGVVPSTPFSEAALAQARARGKPVFVYFTADWCLTCKVNERVAIERETTRDAFARAGVTVLKGDWTRRYPAITRFLESRGVAGVPLYLWYDRNTPEGRTLAQVLGPATLSDLAAANAKNI